MMDDHRQPREQRHPVSGIALLYATLGGGAAWTLHILLAYLIAEFGCETGQDAHVHAGIMRPAWLLLGMSAVMILVSGASTAVAYVCHARLRALGAGATPRNRSELDLARGGLMAGAMFTFIIVVQTIPTFFYLSRC